MCYNTWNQYFYDTIVSMYFICLFVSWADSFNAPAKAEESWFIFQQPTNNTSRFDCQFNSTSSIRSFLQRLDSCPCCKYHHFYLSSKSHRHRLVSSYYFNVFISQATHSLNDLRWLSLSGNPITAMMNTSFYGVSPRLEYLDVTRLRTRILEVRSWYINNS